MSSFRAPGESWTTELTDAPSGQAADWTVALIQSDTREVVIPATNSGVTEDAGALTSSYYKTFALPADLPDGPYKGLWTNGDTVLYDDTEVRVGAAYRAPTAVTVVSPLADNGRLLQVTVGDDYLLADGRALSFLDAEGAWPDLTGASITLAAEDANADGSNFVAPGSVVTPTGTNKEISVELPSALTGALEPASVSKFDIQATLATGHEVTLLFGRLISLAAITA